MIKKLSQNPWGKEEIGSLLSSPNKLSFLFFYLLILFLPTQFGKHFWPGFSFVFGVRSDYLSPTIFTTDLFIFFIILFSVNTILRRVLKFKRALLYFVIFILFLIFGAAVSKNPLAGFLGILRILEYIYLGVFVYFNFKFLNKKIVAFVLGFTIIFEAVLATAQYINQGALQGMFYFLGERFYNGQTPGVANASSSGSLILRSYGTYSHPNVLAGVTLLSYIFILLLKANVNKIFLCFAFVSTILVVTLSLSRTAIVCFFLFVLSYFILAIFEKYKKERFNRRIINFKNIAAGVFVLLLILYLANALYVARFSSLNITDETVTQRKILILNSISMISSDPVFGVGVNNFLNNLKIPSASNLNIQPVHNIFLLTFAQAGIVGFALLIYLFIMLFKKSINTKRFYKVSLVIVLIILGSFDHYLFTQIQGQIIFTIITSSLLKIGN